MRHFGRFSNTVYEVKASQKPLRDRLSISDTETGFYVISHKIQPQTQYATIIYCYQEVPGSNPT